MSEDLKECPSCQSPYGYESSDKEYTCPECSFVWILEEPVDFDHIVVLDVNGVALANGDSIIIIKDLPVKGAPKPVIKTGTKVKNIRLAFGDHNIDCKIDGFGSMALKSEFVRKA